MLLRYTFHTNFFKAGIFFAMQNFESKSFPDANTDNHWHEILYFWLKEK